MGKIILKIKYYSKYLAMAILLAISVYMIYFFHFKTYDNFVYTHFFYIPVILASYWWKKNGIAVSILLGFLLISAHLFSSSEYIFRDIIRSSMFVVISTVVAILSGRIDKAKEHEIRELALQNRLILEAAGEGIFGLDINGNHTFVNPAAAWMLDYEIEELIGKHSHMIWHHTKKDGTPFPDKECPIYAAYSDGKVHVEDDDIFWRKNGTSFNVKYVSTPIYDGDVLKGAVVAFSDITIQKQMEMEKEKLLLDLQDTLAKVKTLSGLLPICASCKKIRDDKGYWNQIEKYLIEHSDIQLSHSLCQDCVKKLYPDYAEELLDDEPEKGKSEP